VIGKPVRREGPRQERWEASVGQPSTVVPPERRAGPAGQCRLTWPGCPWDRAASVGDSTAARRSPKSPTRSDRVHAPHNRAILMEVVFSLMLGFMPGLISLASAGGSEDGGLLTCPVEGGRLNLRYGISHAFYYKVCGRNAEMYADRELLGRKYMDDHDGDWCAFLLKIEDGVTLRLGGTSAIELTLEDGTVVVSTVAVALNAPNETKIWTSEAAPLVFRNGACAYGRRQTPGSMHGAYVLYVRFPEGRCLTGKTGNHDRERQLKAKPILVRIVERR